MTVLLTCFALTYTVQMLNETLDNFITNVND